MLLILPSLLTPSLPSPPHIPPTSTTARQTKLNKPRDDRRSARHPHEREHLHADTRANVERMLAGHRIFHDDEHDRRDDAGHGRAERGEEGEEHDDQGWPAAEDREGADEDHDEGEADPC